MSLELESARQALAEQVDACQRQLREVSLNVDFEVDPLGLPLEAAPLRDFARTGLGVVVSALFDAVKEQGGAAALHSKIAKVLVRCDAGAATSRFDFEPGQRLLVVMATPKLDRWVDFLAFKDFLRTEIGR